MPKIFVYSNNSDDVDIVITPLQEVGYILYHSVDFEKIFDEASEFAPDVVVLSLEFPTEEVSRICRKIKLLDPASDVQIILIVDNDSLSEGLSQAADGYVSRPVNPAIMMSTINSHLRLKNHMNIFSANNDEMAKRFWQLKTLYETSSKLAGTLNRKKLIEIMNDGLEQSISYSLCSTLIINNIEDILLLINSTYPVTKRLEHALKLRAVITYKSMFPDNDFPVDFNINNIKTEVNFKSTEQTYDLEVMRFSCIFSPISTQDKFFGTVEIMRDTELSADDSTCFQTVVSQVALPLESAILYEEIQEKNARLVKLEKLKSEFVSIVSHELRTPLTAIKNALDIMLSGKTGEINDKMSNFLNMGKRNVVRLAGIINDLLDLSKIEAGKMEYRFERINLQEPLNMAFATFKPMAQERQIELSIDINATDTFVYADSSKIEQVLSNLVSNAIKFTNQNGSVKITLGEYTKNDNYWQVEVKDSGIGISSENIEKVFDKFQQIENSLSRKVGGTGLGLPIAKELILSHKGNIWVESEENIGSTFAFVLPKYSVYNEFLLETEMFFEKTKSANTNFALIKIKSDNITDLKNTMEQELKFRKIFKDNNALYLITNTLNDNGFELYLEKLKDFIKRENNDKILLKYTYCDFKQDKSFIELMNDFEKDE